MATSQLQSPAYYYYYYDYYYPTATSTAAGGLNLRIAVEWVYVRGVLWISCTSSDSSFVRQKQLIDYRSFFLFSNVRDPKYNKTHNHASTSTCVLMPVGELSYANHNMLFFFAGVRCSFFAPAVFSLTRALAYGNTNKVAVNKTVFYCDATWHL
jgi:hypothetical protein